EEGPEMGDSSRRAQAQPVFAERSVGEDADPRGGPLVVLHRDAVDLDARLEGEHLLPAAEAVAVEMQLHFHSAGAAAGFDEVERRGEPGVDGSEKAGNRDEAAEHGSGRAGAGRGFFPQAFFSSRTSSTCPPSTISMGRPPGAMSSLSAVMPIWW